MASRVDLLPLVLVLLAGCPGPAVEISHDEGSSSTATGSVGTSSTGLDAPTSSSSSGSADVTTSSAESTTTGVGDDSTTGTVAPSDPGCPDCIVLVDALVGGRGLALDASHVYFTDQSQGTVSRILKDGGDGGVLVEGQDAPYDIAVDDTHVYWTNFADDGAVMRAPKDGGRPELVASATRPRPVVVNDTHVYWASFEVDDGDLFRIDLGLVSPEEHLASIASGIAGLALGDTHVYFTAHAEIGGSTFISGPNEEPIGGVFQVPFVGMPDPFNPTLLAGDQAQPWGLSLAPSGALVWANGDGLPGNDANSLMTLPAGGSPQVLDGSASAPWGVATDTTWAYYTDNDRVFAVDLEGGAPVPLAAQQNGARSIAVDDDDVFWITRERVLQRPKPR